MTTIDGFMPLTVAELKARAAELELKAEQYGQEVPGKSVHGRYARRKFLQAQAADYRRLVSLAEKG